MYIHELRDEYNNGRRLRRTSWPDYYYIQLLDLNKFIKSDAYNSHLFLFNRKLDSRLPYTLTIDDREAADWEIFSD